MADSVILIDSDNATVYATFGFDVDTPDENFTHPDLGAGVNQYKGASVDSTGNAYTAAYDSVGGASTEKLRQFDGFSATILDSVSIGSLGLEGMTLDGDENAIYSDESGGDTRYIKLDGFSSTILDSFTVGGLGRNDFGHDPEGIVAIDSSEKMYKYDGFSSTILDSVSVAAVDGATNAAYDGYGHYNTFAASFAPWGKLIQFQGFSATISDSSTNGFDRNLSHALDGLVFLYVHGEKTASATVGVTIGQVITVELVKGVTSNVSVGQNISTAGSVYNLSVASSISATQDAKQQNVFADSEHFVGVNQAQHPGLHKESVNHQVTASQQVTVFNLHQHVTSEVGVTQNARHNIHILSVESSLGVTQVDRRIEPPVFGLGSSVVVSQQTAIGPNTFNRLIQSLVGVSQDVRRAFELAVSNGLIVSQDQAREFFESHNVQIDQTILEALSTAAENVVAVNQQIILNKVLSLQSYSTPHGIPNAAPTLIPDNIVVGSYATGYIERTVGYNPIYTGASVGCLTPIPAAPNLQQAAGVIFSDGVDTVILRNPEFGDRLNIGARRISRETRGKTRKVYKGCLWPTDTTLKWSFREVRRAPALEFRAFLLRNIGKQITVKDYDGRFWEGIILNPETAFNQDRSDRYSFELEFIGDLTHPSGSVVSNVIVTQQAETGDDSYLLEHSVAVGSNVAVEVAPILPILPANNYMLINAEMQIVVPTGNPPAVAMINLLGDVALVNNPVPNVID